MAKRLQFGTALRNARLNAIESVMATAKLEIWSGTMPVNCGAADTGTLLCQMTLPSNFMNDAVNGVKTILGTWTADGLATGDASYFRFKHYGFAGINTIHCQGNIIEAGGPEDAAMELDNVHIVAGQPVTVTLFTLTEGNA